MPNEPTQAYCWHARALEMGGRRCTRAVPGRYCEFSPYSQRPRDLARPAEPPVESRNAHSLNFAGARAAACEQCDRASLNLGPPHHTKTLNTTPAPDKWRPCNLNQHLPWAEIRIGGRRRTRAGKDRSLIVRQPRSARDIARDQPRSRDTRRKHTN
jgi:hypothetical protein